MKSFKKIFSVLFICILLSFTVCSDYLSCYNVNATGTLQDISNDLMYYILSITGSIDRKNANNLLDSTIQGVSSSVRSALLNEINNQITNGGIYEDSGNYVFSTSAMSAFYNLLGGSNSDKIKIVSDFSSFNFYGSPANKDYVNNNFINAVTTSITNLRNSGIPFLVLLTNSSSPNQYNNYQTEAHIFELPSSFAYLSQNNDQIFRFYDNNGSNISVKDNYISIQYYNGYFQNLYTTSWNTNYISNSFTATQFEAIPYYVSSTNSCLEFYCDNSFIFGKVASVCNGAFNQSDGIYYFNNYQSITVEKNIVNNNNWSSIYNSYVNNVSNTYNTEVTNNNGNGLTAKQVRQIMNTYISPIYDAINDGLTNIEEQVDYVNEWLFKIYQNQIRVVNDLDSIIQLLQNSGSGSGSSSSTTSGCVWTTEQAAIVVDKITRLYTEQADSNIDIVAALEYLKSRVNNLDGYTSDILDNSDTIVTDLATINTALDTIADKLDDLGGGVDITLPNIPLDVIDDIIDLLTNEVDDIVDSLDVVGNVLETAVPFCFLAAFGAIINGLSATPVAPEALTWEIPFQSGDGVVDEVFVIDLSFLDSIHSIWISFVVIVFVIGLMALSFRIFTTFGTLIN